MTRSSPSSYHPFNTAQAFCYSCHHNESLFLGNMKRTTLSLSLFLCLFALGCDGQWWHNVPGWGGEWWTRGQPRSPEELLSASRESLKTALNDHQAQRPEIAPSASQIESALTLAYSSITKGDQSPAVLAELEKATNALLSLEGKLSVGSRAAYGELCGQLRSFEQRVQEGSELKTEDFRSAFGTYAARTLTFLSVELQMPAPVA